MPQSRTRFLSLALVLCVAAAGCARQPGDPIPANTLHARMRAVSIGQSLNQVHAILGTAPVRNPNRRGPAIRTPLREVEIRAPDGGVLRVEVYVTRAWRTEGCPDFGYQDVPLTFVDGVLVGRDWNFLEWNWGRYGGALRDLRLVQDRLQCDEPISPAPPT